MKPDEHTQAWVERWQAAGPALDRERRERLADLTNEEAAAAIDALLDLGAASELPARRERNSGLVAQQTLFKTLR